MFSFSLPEESEAAWLLKQWKREGKVISHVIQTAIEYGAKEKFELESDLESHFRTATKATVILQEVFGVNVGDFRFMPLEHPSKGLELWPGVNQPIKTFVKARDAFKSRSEWVLNGGWDQ